MGEALMPGEDTVNAQVQPYVAPDFTWLAARLGNAIDVSVDRVINTPQVVYDASQAYGVDGNGQIYQLGKTNQQAVKGPVVGAANPQMLLMIIIAIVMLAKDHK